MKLQAMDLYPRVEVRMEQTPLDMYLAQPDRRRAEPGYESVGYVLNQLCTNPVDLLVRKWNWKSCIFSSSTRASIFLFTNLAAGWRAATGAMLVEFLYRAVTAGFYGAMTQSFRRAQPAWLANLVVMILLPLVQHSIELAIHLARGTPKLITSILASACFTAVSTLFNLYAMRRGLLVVGDPQSGSVREDLRQIPGAIVDFVCSGPLALYRMGRNYFTVTVTEP